MATCHNNSRGNLFCDRTYVIHRDLDSGLKGAHQSMFFDNWYNCSADLVLHHLESSKYIPKNMSIVSSVRIYDDV